MRKILLLTAALMAALMVGTSVFAVTDFPLDEYELPLIPVTPTSTESSPTMMWDGAYITYNLEHVVSSNTHSTEWMRFETILAPEKGYKITNIDIWYGNEEVVPTDNGDGTYTVIIDNIVNPFIYVNARAEPTCETLPQESTKPIAQENKPVISKKSITLKAGSTKTLTVKNGKVKSWKTSNSRIVKVNNGKVTALSKGSATVTAVLTDNTKLKCKAVVTTSPKLSKSTVQIKKGKTATVKIIGKATAVSNVYTNTKTAKITSKRSASALKVKALKKGTTTLKIKVNGAVTLKLKVKVK